jgi:hypothetical protein
MRDIYIRPRVVRNKYPKRTHDKVGNISKYCFLQKQTTKAINENLLQN